MRHLHFVQSLEPLQGGGLGGAALGLHLAQLDAGIASQLAATCGEAFHGDWREVRQFRRLGPQKAFFAPDLPAAAKRAVCEASVVHGHGFHTFVNWAFGFEARRQGRPLVYHVQGFFDPWIRARSRIKKRLAGILFEDANFQHARLWRALTRKEQQQIRDYGIRQEVVIAPNGVHLEDIDRPSDEPASLPRLKRLRECRLLFLGRIHPKKGLDLLIPAWAELAREFPKWELAIVGPDEGGYQRTVEQMIVQSGVADSCRVLPTVSGDAKNAVFRTADAFVLPSYSEGFPVAVVEAAAHRLPVIMTDECNFPELAEAGAAWECKPDQASLIAALRKALMTDPAERRQRGYLGRRLVEEAYTWPRIARRISDACAAL